MCFALGREGLSGPNLDRTPLLRPSQGIFWKAPRIVTTSPLAPTRQAAPRHIPISADTLCGVVISLVRFKSALSDEEVQAKFEARADAYEGVPGLIEKLYLRYRSGEFGAVYVWEDEDALAAFRTSELGSSIASAYQVEGGEVSYEVADVTLAVRPTLAER
jgi:heme-degrading monooxygenase HmoA